MILSITKQVTYKKERKVSKKMFSTKDDETKTNQRINDKYGNCILEQKSAAMYQAVLRIKAGCTVITRKTWTHAIVPQLSQCLKFMAILWVIL